MNQRAYWVLGLLALLISSIATGATAPPVSAEPIDTGVILLPMGLSTNNGVRGDLVKVTAQCTPPQGESVAFFSVTMYDNDQPVGYAFGQGGGPQIEADLTVPDVGPGAYRLEGTCFTYTSSTGFTPATFTVNAGGPNLAIGDPVTMEGDQGSAPLGFTLRLSSPATTDVTARLTTADSNAKAGSDYVAKSNVLVTIPAGDVSAKVTVAIKGDTTLEPTEYFIVTLTQVQGAFLKDGFGVATILDDDSIGNGIAVGDAAVVEGHAGTGAMAVPVRLSAPRAGDVTVHYKTVDGTATGGSDFTRITAGVLTIPAGDVSATILVQEKGDITVEQDETLQVVLSNPNGAQIIRKTGLVTIRNDDAIGMWIGEASVVEGDVGSSTAWFPIRLSQPSDGDVLICYGTHDLTATGGSDFTQRASDDPCAYGATIKAGQVFALVPVVVKGDKQVENNETFILNAHAMTAGTSSVRTSALGKIIDDDTVGNGLAIGDVSVFEGHVGNAASARFTVRLSAAVDHDVTVSAASVPGTATPGTDYITLPDTLITIPAGKVSATVTVTIKGDIAIEPNEAFGVVLSNPTGATITRSTGLGVIRDDDPISGVPSCGGAIGGVRC